MIGQTIAHYKVTAKLGEGGMGVVYRATDTKLGRDVALKILPQAFTSDAQRMARFQREAQVLASLNHPNIAAIYGFEQSGNAPALAMELVEGPTLAERIAGGAVSIDEALPIARQIAEALEYAHEKSVIHRDLKPANIKLTADGQVKVLDFGLAKALAEESAELEQANSPTLSMAATKAGIILGTAAYMSPEQARAKAVDRRADVWSFGVVLYEMLTGRRAFVGEDASETMAAVLRADVDWNALPTKTPRSLRQLLQRCLERNPRRRLQSIGEARILLEDVLSGTQADTAADDATQPSATARQLLPWALAGVLLLVASALGLAVLTRPTVVPPTPARFEVRLSPQDQLDATGETSLVLALSPDGKTLAYSAVREGVARFYLRPLDQLTARVVPGSEAGSNPFFSPDGKWLAFESNGQMWKVPVDSGGSPLPLAPADWGGGTWAKDGTIVYTRHYSGGLWRVSATDGKPAKLTEPDHAQGEVGHWWPRFLPDGKTVLFTAFSAPVSKAKIFALNLETGTKKLVLEGGTYPHYVPTGHMIFMRAEGLMAAPFDARRVEVTGPPVRVLEDAFLDPQDGYSLLSVSENGALAYVPKGTIMTFNHVFFVDRKGKSAPLLLPQGYYKHPRLSPDGQRLSLTTATSEIQDVVVFDLARNTLTKVASGPTSEFNAIWTADGKRLIYNLEKTQFDIFMRAADGTGSATPLAESVFDKTPSWLSPDGKTLLYTEHHPDTRADLWVTPVDGSGKPQPYLRTPDAESAGAFSPDGRWVAYESSASGTEQIFVQSFPQPGERFQISTEGGAAPYWSREGSEIFYRHGDKMMSVKVKTQPVFSAGKPEVLFHGAGDKQYPGINYELTRDGRFVIVRTPPELAPRSMVVVLNWFEELKRLVPVGK